MCNECGNCETFCPFQGSPYKDKITLFWNEDDFTKSTNDGFFLIDENSIKVRFNSRIFVQKLNELNDNIEWNSFVKLMNNVLENHNYLLNKTAITSL